MYSDEARRCSEAVNIHLQTQGHWAIGRWVAIRLSDGGSDMVMYDKKADAVRHQLHEFQCAYVCIPPHGMSAKDAEGFLRVTRHMYDKGVRLADPDKPVIERG